MKDRTMKQTCGKEKNKEKTPHIPGTLLMCKSINKIVHIKKYHKIRLIYLVLCHYQQTANLWVHLSAFSLPCLYAFSSFWPQIELFACLHKVNYCKNMSDQTAVVSVKCLFVYGLFVRFVDHKNNIIFKWTYYLKQKQLLNIYVG